jgi:TolA-binding protein
VSRGQYQAVVTAAEARGIEACLSNCAIGDLRSLADAARYSGRTDLAERSLQAIRQRAAAGPSRSAAAFLLGRVSESRGQVRAADTWYDTYLNESPGGEFAADALAGRMRAAVRLNGNAAGKPLAVQYLQRYPNGVHADMARKIAGSQ